MITTERRLLKGSHCVETFAQQELHVTKFEVGALAFARLHMRLYSL